MACPWLNDLASTDREPARDLSAGGSSKTVSNDTSGLEVAVLNAETCVWERPTTARLYTPMQGQTATVVGRTKVMTLGGVRGDLPSADVTIFNTDTMKWFTPQVKGLDRCAARISLAIGGTATVVAFSSQSSPTTARFRHARVAPLIPPGAGL